jgi:tRNA-dihydrouridine synthase B
MQDQRVNRIPAFDKLGFPRFPVLLAPLAGVSDHPFRRVCARQGASLTYVEMLSAKAILFKSKRTFDMMARHADEGILGVQVTGGSAQDVAGAIEILDRHAFDTIDINMGCPVSKVVRSGSGSAILREPDRVYETVRLARMATAKPLSVKVRLGWDRSSVTIFEVADAAQSAGAEWITVHGRLRSEDYSYPVDLAMIAAVKKRLSIPVFGNGNIFTAADAAHMSELTGVDGVMVSRGALGNPWVFRDIFSMNSSLGESGGSVEPSTLPGMGMGMVLADEWLETVLDHLQWQQEAYGPGGMGAVCMRKHLLWYAKGWPGAKKLRERINTAESISSCENLVREFHAGLIASGITLRLPIAAGSEDEGASAGQRFVWDPKFDMDRKLDRGVGDDDGAASRLV